MVFLVKTILIYKVTRELITCQNIPCIEPNTKNNSPYNDDK